MSLLHGQSALEHLSTWGVAVYVKDLQGRYLAINHQCATLLGRSREEILGGDDYDLFTPRDAQITIVRDHFVVCRSTPLVFESTARPSATGELTAFHSIKTAIRNGPDRLATGLLGLSFLAKECVLDQRREIVTMLTRLAQHRQDLLLATLRRRGCLLAVS